MLLCKILFFFLSTPRIYASHNLFVFKFYGSLFSFCASCLLFSNENTILTYSLTRTYIHTPTHPHTHTPTHTRTHARTHARTHTHTHRHTHTHTHTHTLARTHARTVTSSSCATRVLVHECVHGNNYAVIQVDNNISWNEHVISYIVSCIGVCNCLK